MHSAHRLYVQSLTYTNVQFLTVTGWCEPLALRASGETRILVYHRTSTEGPASNAHYRLFAYDAN